MITNVKEFRIGNLVQWDDPSHEITKITEIKKSKAAGYAFSFKGGCAQIGEFVPVKINDKWLARLGFRRIMFGKIKTSYFTHGYVQVSTDGDLWSIGYGSYIGYISYNADYKLKYVHQVQNFYFAVIGKELIIKK